MARVAQKAGIVFTNETTLVDAAAAAQATLLPVACRLFADAYGGGRGVPGDDAAGSVPSRGCGRGLFQAAAQAATSFSPSLSVRRRGPDREAAARSGTGTHSAPEYRRTARWADTFGFIPNEVLDVLLGNGEIADLEFHVLTDSGVERKSSLAVRGKWFRVGRSRSAGLAMSNDIEAASRPSRRSRHSATQVPHGAGWRGSGPDPARRARRALGPGMDRVLPSCRSRSCGPWR